METTHKEKESENQLVKILIGAIIMTLVIFLVTKHGLFWETIYKSKFLSDKVYLGLLKIKLVLANMLIFKEPSLLLYVCLLFLVLYGTVSRAKVNLKYSKITANFYLFASFICFLIIQVSNNLYVDIVLLFGFVLFFIAGSNIHSSLVDIPAVDQFNEANQTFLQTEKIIKTNDSINLMYKYYYNGWRKGFINMIATTRATMVMGTAGSGKTASILVPALWQSIYKGQSGILYDFKYPSMTLEAFNAYFKAIKNNPYVFGKKNDDSPIIPEFKVVNFSDLKTSSRVNPIDPIYIKNINSAQEAAKTLLVNINRSWIGKESEFFNASGISLVTMAIYYLKIVSEKHNRYVCTIPHMIELINTNINEQIKVYNRYPELRSLSGTFQVAIDAGAGKQLAGQVASATTALSTLASKEAYWVLSRNDFMLNVNNPNKPIILCLGNDRESRTTFGAIIAVFFSSAFKLMKKGDRRGFVMVDELPTVFLNDISYVINTIREIGVSVWLGIQDLAQLVNDYKKEGADVVMNACGSIFWGTVNFETAEKVSKIFGNTNQRKINVNVGKSDSVDYSISSDAKPLLPPSVMTVLSPGRFAGKIADNFTQTIEQKLMYGDIYLENMDKDRIFTELPKIYNNTSDELDMLIEQNFERINVDIKEILEMERSR